MASAASYPCCYCGKEFDSLSDHSQHIYRSHKLMRDVPFEGALAHTTVAERNTHSSPCKRERMDFHKCLECGKMFDSKDLYLVHMKRHTGMKRYRCNICGNVFRSLWEMKIHVTKVHSSTVSQYVSNVSLKKDPRSKADTSVKAQTVVTTKLVVMCAPKVADSQKQPNSSAILDIDKIVVPVKCLQCQRQFNNKASLNAHIQTHSVAKIYRCDTCSMLFVTQDEVDSHIKSTHLPESVSSSNISSKSQKVPNAPEKEDTRGKTDRLDKTQTVITNTGVAMYTPKLADSQIRPNSISANLGKDKAQVMVRCLKCPKFFNYIDKAALRAHMQTHSVQKIFRCVTCGMLFVTQGEVDSHIKSTHHPEGVSSSNTSSKAQKVPNASEKEDTDRLDKTQTVITQTVITNTGVATYTPKLANSQIRPNSISANLRKDKAWVMVRCLKCPKLFNDEAALRAHMQTHSVQKIYRCVTCSMLFGTQGEVDSHIKSTHHPESVSSSNTSSNAQKVPNASEKEDPRSKANTSEKAQTFVTTTFVTMCAPNVADLQKQPNSSAILDLDKIRVLFTCLKCQRQFNDKASLNAHMQTHLVQKIYRCDTCGMLFDSQEEADSHIKSMHLSESVSSSNISSKAQKVPNASDKVDTRSKTDRLDKTQTVITNTGVATYTPKLADSQIQPNSILANLGKDKAQVIIRCLKCPKLFIDEASLRAHMPTHSVQKIYHCDTCSLLFDSQEEADSHIKSMHLSQSASSSNSQMENRLCLSEHKQQTASHLSHPEHKLYRIIMQPVETVAGNSQRFTKPQNHETLNFIGNEKESSTMEKNQHGDINTVDGPHICVLCGEEFNTWDAVNSHLESHNVGKPYKCSQCTMSFSTDSNLKEHVLIHETEARQDSIHVLKPHQCLICGVWFNNKVDLIEHICTHVSTESPACPYCGQRAADLKEHLLSHLVEQVNTRTIYKCSHCGMAFGKSRELQDHARYCKPCELESTSPKALFVPNQEKGCDSMKQFSVQPDNLTILKPSVCQTGFKTVSIVRSHMNSDTNPKYYEFRCGVCGTPTAGERFLSQHLRRHLKEDPLTCLICTQRFTSLSALTEHALTHTSDTDVLCPYCSYGCTDLAELRVHFQVHLKEGYGHYGLFGKGPPRALLSKPTKNVDQVHRCDYCDKAFPNRYELKHHRMIHRSGESFQCGLCKKQFMNAKVLFDHLQKLCCNVASEQDEGSMKIDVATRGTVRVGKPVNIKCDVCEKRFDELLTYKKHMRTHQGKICSICGMVFENLRRLKNHLRIHKKEPSVHHQERKGNLFSLMKQGMRLRVTKVLVSTGDECRECSVCNKTFMLRKTPFTEKVHTCSQCSVSSSNSLSENMYDFTEQAYTRIYPLYQYASCDVCVAGFLEAHQLEAHLKTHMVSCPDCGVEFPCRAAYRTHQEGGCTEGTVSYRAHCAVCVMDFLSVDELEAHLKVHENPT